MPRNLAHSRHTRALDTGSRIVDLPVDAYGHNRAFAKFDSAQMRSTDSADSAGKFAGHAALFNTRTWIGSKRFGFWEELAPEAFNKTLADGADVRFLDQHDPARLLARTASGTLTLGTDKVGLAVDADIAPTSVGRDVAISLARGDMSQMSFAFDMMTYEWSELDDGSELLTHREVQLYDVSTVTYPAYEETDAALRSLQGALRSLNRGHKLTHHERDMLTTWVNICVQSIDEDECAACPDCGADCAPGDKYCPQCGAALDATDSTDGATIDDQTLTSDRSAAPGSTTRHEQGQPAQTTGDTSRLALRMRAMHVAELIGV